MIRAVLALALVVGGPAAAIAQSRPPAPAPDMIAAPGKAGWVVDSRKGCWLWNADPQPNETVTWSGACGPDGRATGKGTAEWFLDGKPDGRYEGELRDGKLHGRGVYTWTTGNVYDG